MYTNYLVVFTSILDAKLFVDDNGNYHKYSDNCEIDNKEKALEIANCIAQNLNDYERVNVYEYLYNEDTGEDITNKIL